MLTSKQRAYLRSLAMSEDTIIIIGKGGQSLKKVGTQARIDMEDFFQKKVFLSLYVKVDPDWRESKRELRKFGYEY